MSLRPQAEETSAAYTERLSSIRLESIGKRNRASFSIALQCAKLIGQMWHEGVYEPTFANGKLVPSASMDPIDKSISLMIGALGKYEELADPADIIKGHVIADRVGFLSKTQGRMAIQEARKEIGAEETTKEKEFVASFRRTIDQILNQEGFDKRDDLGRQLTKIRKECSAFLNSGRDK